MYEAVWWILAPSSLLALAVLLAFVAVRLRRRSAASVILAVLTAALIAITVVPLDDWLAAPLEDRYPAPSPLPARVDGIVVLGGSVDWRVTRARAQLTLDDAGERMVAVLALARRYPDAELVFTGLYQDELRSGWIHGERTLFASAFAGHDVHFLGAASSTYQEALQAGKLIGGPDGGAWLLVTSALHMPRAVATFRTLGANVVPFPVDYRSTGDMSWRFDPRLGRRLAELDRVVREWGALWVYRRSGRIAPEPAPDAAPGPGTAVSLGARPSGPLARPGARRSGPR